MFIKTLAITNFRNHSKTTLQLSPSTNILVGKNAQGKTNLLEAIFLTCVGRGWRTNKDREMINFEAENALIKTIVCKKFGDVDIEISLSRKANKGIKINNIPIQKMGELMGQVNCVFFSPDELRLIKDAPSDRRRFLDIDISQINKTYFYALMRYNKILLQRNALLKNKDEDINRAIEIWDSQLAKTGAYIIFQRLLFINQLRASAAKVHEALTSNKEEIKLSYINITASGTEAVAYESTSGMCHVAHSEDSIEKILLAQLQNSHEKDMRLKTTTVGPHRDDIQILINGKDVRFYASQGQQRTVALSLKLAEVEIFKNCTSESPVLLLDDVFSELDIERQTKLLHAIAKYQSIITSTTPPNIHTTKNTLLLRVSNGSIVD